MPTHFEDSIDEHLRVIEKVRTVLPTLEQIALKMSQAILNGKKVIWCGNGGSAADSQHLAAELVGRFGRERRASPSLAMTTNTSVLTAIGNDYGYERIFQRQVEALCQAGDVVVGLSTSGKSQNVCLALKAARELGARTVAFTGQNRGAMAEIAEMALQIPSTETARIQEAHILCGHMLCDYIESRLWELEGHQAKTPAY
jgi:D-sedoheptulose 7-phosphate isomerase